MVSAYGRADGRSIGEPGRSPAKIRAGQPFLGNAPGPDHAPTPLAPSETGGVIGAGLPGQDAGPLDALAVRPRGARAVPVEEAPRGSPRAMGSARRRRLAVARVATELPRRILAQAEPAAGRWEAIDAVGVPPTGTPSDRLALLHHTPPPRPAVRIGGTAPIAYDHRPALRTARAQLRGAVTVRRALHRRPGRGIPGVVGSIDQAPIGPGVAVPGSTTGLAQPRLSAGEAAIPDACLTQRAIPRASTARDAPRSKADAERVAVAVTATARLAAARLADRFEGAIDIAGTADRSLTPAGRDVAAAPRLAVLVAATGGGGLAPTEPVTPLAVVAGLVVHAQTLRASAHPARATDLAVGARGLALGAPAARERQHERRAAPPPTHLGVSDHRPELPSTNGRAGFCDGIHLRWELVVTMRGLAGTIVLTALASGCGGTDGAAIGPPRLDLSPVVFDFGVVGVGTPARAEGWVRNRGQEPLHLAARIQSGPPGLEVEVRPSELGPGGVGRLRLELAEPPLGRLAGTVVLTSNDPERPALPVRFLGEGIAGPLRPSRSELDLGGVLPGRPARARFDVQNVGDRPVPLHLAGSVDRCEDRPRGGGLCVRRLDGPLGGDRTASVGPGQSVRLEVEARADPTGAPMFAVLRVGTCPSERCGVDVPIRAVPVDVPLDCTPAEVDFGAVPPGSVGQRTVRCRNRLLEPLTVVEARVEGRGFSVGAPRPPLPLGPGAWVSMPVDFRPQALGVVGAELVVATDLAERGAAVPLVGSGGGPSLAIHPPGGLDFGAVSLIAPGRRQLELINTGFAPLSIREIVVDEAELGVFSSPDTGADTLEPGQSKVVVIEFDPDEEARFESYVRILTDAAVAETRVRLSGRGLDIGPCRYAITPGRLDFASVPRGRALTRTLRVENRGNATCLFVAAGLRPASDTGFRYTGPVRAEIPPGGQLLLPVAFTPQRSGAQRARLGLGLSDPDAPFPTIELGAEGVDERVLIAPDAVDFGPVGLGCGTEPASVRLVHSTAAPVRVTKLRVVDDHGAFSLVDPPPVPFVISAQSTPALWVGFAALSTRQFVGSLEIDMESEGATVTRIVPLRGQGSLQPVAELTHTQLDHPSDLLFVVDRSVGMADELHGLSDNLASFFALARRAPLDWQAAVTTTDLDDEGGRLCSAEPGTTGRSRVDGPPAFQVVGPAALGAPLEALASNLSFAPAGGAAEDESGLASAAASVRPPPAVGASASLLRPNAHLGVVYLSDEPDQSTRPVSDYLDVLRAAVGSDRNRLTVSAIVAPEGGCAGPSGSASTLGRYAEGVDGTGGTVATPCTPDWTATAAMVGPASLGLRSVFFLRYPADPGARPVVTVDGTQVPAERDGVRNWSFDREARAIRFTASATPEPGSRIRIAYPTHCR